MEISAQKELELISADMKNLKEFYNEKCEMLRSELYDSSSRLAALYHWHLNGCSLRYERLKLLFEPYLSGIVINDVSCVPLCSTVEDDCNYESIEDEEVNEEVSEEEIYK